MPIQPVSLWESEYESKIQATFSKQAEDPMAVAVAHQDWLDVVSKGISVSPPFVSMGTPNKSAFAPLIFPKAGTPPVIANLFSTAWFAWYMAIQWQPVPPLPPFSVIQQIVSDPATAGAAKTMLFSLLLAEFSVNPPNAEVSKMKPKRIGSYFYQATMMCGVLVIGMSLPTPTPLPLIVPAKIM